MTIARVELKPYSNKVLNVIKAKYDLNDKSEALNKFIELYGDSEVEQEATDEYVKKILQIEEKHFKKYGFRTTTIEKMRKEIEVD